MVRNCFHEGKLAHFVASCIIHTLDEVGTYGKKGKLFLPGLSSIL